MTQSSEKCWNLPDSSPRNISRGLSEFISYTLLSSPQNHYNDVIMGAIASQITSLTSVYSILYSDADQRKHQSSASLAFMRGIHRGPVNSPHKWPVTRKMFPFDDVIMAILTLSNYIAISCSCTPLDFVPHFYTYLTGGTKVGLR